MSALQFRTITIVEGPAIDEWLERQEALERDEVTERNRVSYRTAYMLLGGAIEDAGERAIPMELLS